MEWGAERARLSVLASRRAPRFAGAAHVAWTSGPAPGGWGSLASRRAPRFAGAVHVAWASTRLGTSPRARADKESTSRPARGGLRARNHFALQSQFGKVLCQIGRTPKFQEISPMFSGSTAPLCMQRARRAHEGPPATKRERRLRADARPPRRTRTARPCTRERLRAERERLRAERERRAPARASAPRRTRAARPRTCERPTPNASGLTRKK
jgi:hypothetical protein